MRVILLNVNAKSGSTGKIVTDIKNVLEQNGHECLICYGANDKSEEGYKRICPETERKTNAVLNRLTGIPHGFFLPFSFFRLKKVIDNWHPDIIHIHCPNGYTLDLFRTLKYLADLKIGVVLTNHAEYFYTGGCGYAYDCKKWLTGCQKCVVIKGRLGLDAAKIEWNQFKTIFDRFDKDKLVVTSVSPWVNERAKCSQALSRFVNLPILNGIDTNIFKKRDISERVLANLPSDKPLILHVTASFNSDLNSIKGGYSVIKLAQMCPDINFVVVCLESKNINDLPANITIWGKANNQIELSELYNAVNLTLLTSRRETFSMIVAESLCCGTPVIGFKAGGPETISIPEYSKFVEYGDYESLVEAIYANLKVPYDRKLISVRGIKKYDRVNMVLEYQKIYQLLSK